VAILDSCCIQAFPEALTKGRAGLEEFGDVITKLDKRRSWQCNGCQRKSILN